MHLACEIFSSPPQIPSHSLQPAPPPHRPPDFPSWTRLANPEAPCLSAGFSVPAATSVEAPLRAPTSLGAPCLLIQFQALRIFYYDHVSGSSVILRCECVTELINESFPNTAAQRRPHSIARNGAGKPRPAPLTVRRPLAAPSPSHTSPSTRPPASPAPPFPLGLTPKGPLILDPSPWGMGHQRRTACWPDPPEGPHGLRAGVSDIRRVSGGLAGARRGAPLSVDHVGCG